MSFNLPVTLDSRAFEDIDAAAQWYAEQNPELAREFLGIIDVALEYLSQFPQAYQEVAPGIRTALTKKFPFSIYYTLDSERVTVFAVLHVRRSPDTWQQRFE